MFDVGFVGGGTILVLKKAATFKMLNFLVRDHFLLEIGITLMFSFPKSLRNMSMFSEGPSILVVVIRTALLVLTGVVFLKVVLLAVKGEHVPFLVVVLSGLVVLFRGIVVGRDEVG